MSMEQTAVGQTTITRRPVPSVNLRALVRMTCAPIAFAVRVVLGESTGPRGYRREGFPNHEIYQLLSGHRDRFDAYPVGSGKRRNG